MRAMEVTKCASQLSNHSQEFWCIAMPISVHYYFQPTQARIQSLVAHVNFPAMVGQQRLDQVNHEHGAAHGVSTFYQFE